MNANNYLSLLLIQAFFYILISQYKGLMSFSNKNKGYLSTQSKQLNSGKSKYIYICLSPDSVPINILWF